MAQTSNRNATISVHVKLCSNHAYLETLRRHKRCSVRNSYKDFVISWSYVMSRFKCGLPWIGEHLWEEQHRESSCRPWFWIYCPSWDWKRILPRKRWLDHLMCWWTHDAKYSTLPPIIILLLNGSQNKQRADSVTTGLKRKEIARFIDS